jgi:hypothetical protein
MAKTGGGVAVLETPKTAAARFDDSIEGACFTPDWKVPPTTGVDARHLEDPARVFKVLTLPKADLDLTACAFCNAVCGENR